ncbi:MAG TPA: DUF4271 domain-containing protein [Saprospiraceae bacterium]|nr:DUF4271 domain-containing protein [Saprospiraceae bacterium]
MFRIFCLVCYLGFTFPCFGQNQTNPFDLKYRPLRPHTNTTKPSIDSSLIKTPVQINQEEPTREQINKPQVDSAAVNDGVSGEPGKDTAFTTSGSNPFELQKGTKKNAEKLSRGSSDIKFHNNPSVKLPVNSPRHMSRGIQIFFILLSLLFLIFIVNVERNFVKDLWRVISNENYSSLHLRNQRNTMRQILLMMGYVIFFIQAGIFLSHLIGFFGYSGGYLNNIWVCVGFVVIIYGVRHIVIRYLRWLFNNEKEMSLFGFDISTFNIMVGLVLLPINVLLNFGPDSMAKPLIIIGLVVIVAAYLMRQLRWMLTARRLIANSLFLFFVYLCAVEILPLWAILKFFW